VRAASTPRRAVLLDRDGTIVVERHYLSRPEEVELLPNAARGLARLAELGFRLVVVTNQSAIARGLINEARLAEIHARLAALLAEEGVRLDTIRHCPHHPDRGCACRKPETGLVEAAAAEIGFDARHSVVIGDKPCDIHLAERLGIPAVLVRSGYGAATAAAGGLPPHEVADDLWDAARIIEHSLLTAPANG
jgi:D-glycero-D-manno-heptose 1,7-bisphosphate phosphatase